MQTASARCRMLIGCVLSHVPRMEFLDNPAAISIVMLRRPASRIPSGYFHGYPHTGDATRGCGKPPSCLKFGTYIGMPRSVDTHPPCPPAVHVRRSPALC